MTCLRPLQALLPKPERPARDAHERRRLGNGKAELASPGAELRRQRVALLAAEFRLSRLQGHGNTRYQKGYMTQMGWLRGRFQNR